MGRSWNREPLLCVHTVRPDTEMVWEALQLVFDSEYRPAVRTAQPAAAAAEERSVTPQPLSPALLPLPCGITSDHADTFSQTWVPLTRPPDHPTTHAQWDLRGPTVTAVAHNDIDIAIM